MELQYTRELDDILTGAIALAGMDRARLVTPEHILMVAMGNPKVMAALNQVTSDVLIGAITKKLRERITDMERIPEDDEDTQVMLSYQYQMLLKQLELLSASASIEVVGIPHMMKALYELKDSYAANCLHVMVKMADSGEFLRYLVSACDREMEDDENGDGQYNDSDDDIIEDETYNEEESEMEDGPDNSRSGSWRDYVLCINDHLADHNPLIGRTSVSPVWARHPSSMAWPSALWMTMCPSR